MYINKISHTVTGGFTTTNCWSHDGTLVKVPSDPLSCEIIKIFVEEFYPSVLTGTLTNQ